jgi:hypothetical protein
MVDGEQDAAQAHVATRLDVVRKVRQPQHLTVVT